MINENENENENENKFLCECGEYVNRIYTKYNKLGECKECYKSSKYLKQIGVLLNNI